MKSYKEKQWTRAELAQFVSLIKQNKSQTEIMPFFPDCSRRQVEHRFNSLIIEHGLKRPLPLKRRSNKKIKEAKRQIDFSAFDFTGDNVEVNDRHGRHVDIRMELYA